MEKSVSFEKFYDFKKNHCDRFFPEDLTTWSSRILLECMNDGDLLEDVLKYVDISNDISAEELDQTMQELRDKTNYYLQQAQESDHYYEMIEKALVYYGLLESLDELASFATNLIQKIREKYGDSYLDVIASFDKGNLSVDGKKVLQEEKDGSIDDQDELLQKYLILKKWQDKQHGYYQSVIEPVLMKMDEVYREEKPLPVDVEIEDPILYRAFYDLSKKPLISMEELKKYYLAGLDREMIKLVGGKAYGLAVLSAHNLPIPESYVIPVNSNEVNWDLFADLDLDIHYSVRSSADIEDGEKNSFAGMFDSYLDVTYDNLLKKTKKVIDSKNNSRLQQYIVTNHLEQPNMAVVIQKYVEPEYAGVWIGKDDKSGYLEHVRGNGEKLVSGRMTPKCEIWENGVCKEESLTCKDGVVGELLLKYQDMVTNHSSEVADFEWMILDGHLVMLQYRPVTSKIDILDQVESSDKEVFSGIPASPGRVTAPARFVNARKINQVTDWQEGDILLAWFTDPEWMHILSKSSAIVTTVGGFLCHAAIIARELGIPCVIGVGPKAMKKLWEEDVLTVDGNQGTVEIDKTKRKKL